MPPTAASSPVPSWITPCATGSCARPTRGSPTTIRSSRPGRRFASATSSTTRARRSSSAGCSRPPSAPVDPPRRLSTDLGRLPPLLQGIHKSGEVVLHEGLPSEFWEPQLREQEVDRKQTIRLHGYPFYAERLALQGA